MPSVNCCPMTTDPMSEAVSIIKELGADVCTVEVRRTEPPYDIYGPTVIVTVKGDASEALKIWVEAARKVHGFILKVRWAGRIDILPEQYIMAYVKAEEEMGIPPFIDPNFDSVEAERD